MTGHPREGHPRHDDDTFVQVLDALLVDDSPETLEEMLEALTLAGLHVRLAQDAEQAVRCLREQEVAVLVTDVRMPGATGLGLAAALRRELGGRAPEIVFVSGHADPATLREAAGLEPREFLLKPVGLPLLVEVVTEAVSAYEQRRRAATPARPTVALVGARDGRAAVVPPEDAPAARCPAGASPSR